MDFSTGSTDSIIQETVILDQNKVNNMWSATAMTMSNLFDESYEEFLRKENIKRKQKERRLKIKEIFSKNKKPQLISN